MVVFRIRAHCLAQEYEWKKEYDNIIDLKKDLFKYFQLYNINEECGIIVYYNEKDQCDCIFDNLDILPKDGTTIFDLYLKRVWACCGICFGQFDIISTHLPLECVEKTCNVQYCVKCVDTICQLDKNEKFTCMFCNKTTIRPQRNILLENIFLWKPYTMRYGGHSIERLETIFNGPNLSDAIHRIKNRQTHIRALQITLKASLAMIKDAEFDFKKSNKYLEESDILIEKLDIFINELKKCERIIKTQPITLRNLVKDYRLLLRDSINQKSFKQEGAYFILLCIKLSALDIETIEYIKTTTEQIIINKSNLFIEYKIDKLKDLIIKESSLFVDEILRDIIYRRETLQDKQKQITDLDFLSSNHPFHTYYLEQYRNATRMIESLNEYEIKFNSFRDIYNEIDKIMFEYKDELTQKTLDEKSLSLPTNEQMSTFECSRLILISELLRSETERIDMEVLFPRITKLIYKWKQDLNIHPKIYDLFSALEQDLLSLYDKNRPLMNLIPFRVGFIGNISVGKSSLVNYLRTKNSISSFIKRTLSPTGVGQSTVGSLQFDEQHFCSDQQTRVTIRYVDIEGCNDYNTKVHAASYFEQIRKADCDLYIILFTGQQGSFECSLEKEINERLNRPCWFVRSKIDQEFNELFNEIILRQKHDNPDIIMNDIEENELADQIIDTIREKASIICKTSSDKIFLINSTYQSNEDNQTNKYNSKNYSFDIDLLSERLINIAQRSYKQERIKRMATMVCAHTIGTCFRRRCITSFIKHQLRASIGAVLIPWGEQMAHAHTCYEIRLALGIQDHSVIYNSVFKKVDIFQTLLLKYSLNIDPNILKSSEFNYLHVIDTSNTTTNQNEYSTTIQLGREQEKDSTISQKFKSSMPGGVVTCGLVGNKIAATTVAVGTLGYGVGIGLLGLSLVAAIPIGLWTLKKSNKQIRDYLDDLCADLLIISEYFIIAIIKQQINNRELS